MAEKIGEVVEVSRQAGAYASEAVRDLSKDRLEAVTQFGLVSLDPRGGRPVARTSQDLRAGPVGFRAMLPPDFLWRSVASRPDGTRDAVMCDGMQVLRLSQRINAGSWFATLNTHRLSAEQRTYRECSSYEQGGIGAERWVSGYKDRLQAEIDRLRVQRPTGNG